MARLDFRQIGLSLLSLGAKKYKPAAIILFMTAMLYASVGIFYKVIGLEFLKHKTAGVTASQKSILTSPVSAKEAFDAYRVIMDRNLFGSTDKSVADKQTGGRAGGPSDVTQMLDLKGTVAGSSRYSFAIIEEKATNKQLLYKVGGTVMGARVVKILRNAVVLRTADREVTLKTAERQLASLVPGSGGNRPSTGTSPSPGVMVLNKAEIDNSLKDMGTMLSTAQVRPSFSAGVADGFMITNIQQQSIFHKIGLQNGDIVQGIDERPLKAAEDMVSFYNQMKTGSPVSLKVKRQGKQEVFQYTFK